ncbi:MAG: Fe-S cluster assembly protein SufD [Alphaproteobacteria bacterium]
MSLQPIRHWLVENQAANTQNSRFNALQAIETVGLPDRKTERWKYTPWQGIEPEHLLPQAAGAVATPATALLTDATILWVVDGVLQPWSVLPEGVSIHQQEPAENDLLLADYPALALNQLFYQQHWHIEIEAGVCLEKPLLLEYVFTGAGACYPFLSIKVREGAKIRLITRQQGQGVALPFMPITLEKNAELRHLSLQEMSCEATHFSTQKVEVGQAALYHHSHIALGGKLARHEVVASLEAEATSHLNGLYWAEEGQHLDMTTLTRHDCINGKSRQTVKGVVDKGARAVFQGKIRVAQGAQKTDGYQMNRALLLSPQAEINAKPELEIYADDVKCSHGASCGELDHDMMFYLQSRGISPLEARGLLIAAFLLEIAELTDDAVFASLVAERLQQLKGLHLP